MVENELTRAIRAFLSEVLKDYAFPTKSGPTRAPQVINGYLPPKRTGSEDDFPFVLVRADEGTSDQESTEVKVAIIIGTYSTDYDGHEYCLNVLARLRSALTSLPGLLLAGRYQLRLPLMWTTYADQPYPQWQLDIQTSWLIRTPVPVSPEEDF